MRRLPTLTLGLVLGCGTLTACAGQDGGTATADCAAVIVLDGHTYLGRARLHRDPPTTGRLVDAVIPWCDDSGGQEPEHADEPVRVAELVDVPLETAFLVHGSVYVRQGRDLPPRTRAWFRRPVSR
jgi:hypothetical protein